MTTNPPRHPSPNPEVGVNSGPGHPGSHQLRVVGANLGGLRLARVAKAYGDRRALDGVDLAIGAGEVAALLGPNGAGKSTLVGVASGALGADAGSVAVGPDGVDPRGAAGANRRLVGVAPQDIGVYPGLTVAENLRAFGELTGLAPKAARARAIELSRPLLLDELLDRRAGVLSGGQQRRLHAAIALVHRPPVVLLDEPTAGADPQTRSALLGVVRSIAAEGTAVLYTTHYLPEVEELGAHVHLLDRGRIIAAGPLDRLVADHGEPALVVEAAGGAASTLLVGRWPRAAALDDRTTSIPHPAPESLIADVVAAVDEAGDAVTRIEVVRPSLEAVYLALTGRRDADDPTDEPTDQPGVSW